MAKTRESRLEEQVERYMTEKGVWQLARYQAQSNQNGLPDRIYLYHGYLLGLELKTDIGAPTDLQWKKLKAINDNGGIGVIIRDMIELDKLMEVIDNYRIERNFNDFIVSDFECWRDFDYAQQKTSKN